MKLERKKNLEIMFINAYTYNMYISCNKLDVVSPLLVTDALTYF